MIIIEKQIIKNRSEQNANTIRFVLVSIVQSLKKFLTLCFENLIMHNASNKEVEVHVIGDASLLLS